MAKKKIKRELWPLFYASLCFIFGITSVIDNFLEIQLGNQSFGWTKSSAVITQNKYYYKKIIHGSDHHFDIYYEYFMGGKKHTSKQIRINDFSDEYRYKEMFKEGDTVPVYLNPKAYSESVLIPGPTDGVYSRLIFGLVMIGFGVLVTVHCFYPKAFD